MKKTILISLIILKSSSFVYGQKVFKSKEYGFEIQEPKNWIEANNKILLENLEKYDITDESLNKLIADNKGSLLLNSFYKYDAKTHAGIIPTIQINVRQKSGSDFEQFKNVIIQSAEGFKKYFEDFEYISQPTEIEISGNKCVFFVGKFTMKLQNGEELKVRSRTYAIPYKNYFFQVNFTDGQIEEDCKKEFDELVKTIKVGVNQ